MQKCTHDGLVQGVALCFWELFTLALCRLCAALREFHMVPGDPEDVLQVEVGNRVREAGDVDHWAAPKVVGKEVHVQGGGHEDEAQVRARRQQVLERDEQEVRKAVSLVNLVNDNVRHTLQVISLGEHAQQDAVGAEHERGLRAAAVLQPDGVAHVVTHVLAALAGHAVRDADGADAARLRTEDAAAAPARPGRVHQKLWHLCRFTAPRLPRNQDDLVLLRSADDLFLKLRGRQSTPLGHDALHAWRSPPGAQATQPRRHLRLGEAGRLRLAGIPSAAATCAAHHRRRVVDAGGGVVVAAE
mmetsp:Transcript_9403/g.23809  ORF Transcript_9403/g.23809 Transcript_9403/m.23809 type:complete len:301 (-) Transcript_9403:406-1308(-)